jgi:hypothetical protein
MAIPIAIPGLWRGRRRFVRIWLLHRGFRLWRCRFRFLGRRGNIPVRNRV